MVKERGSMSLGELERQVMDIHWSTLDRDLTVREVADRFPDHAYTTIMTVMTRLAAKGFLVESKRGRLNVYRARAPREDYITSLIMDALSIAPDRDAVLTRFAEGLTQGDVTFFRRLFSRRSPS